MIFVILQRSRCKGLEWVKRGQARIHCMWNLDTSNILIQPPRCAIPLQLQAKNKLGKGRDPCMHAKAFSVELRVPGTTRLRKSCKFCVHCEVLTVESTDPMTAAVEFVDQARQFPSHSVAVHWIVSQSLLNFKFRKCSMLWIVAGSPKGGRLDVDRPDDGGSLASPQDNL